MRTTRTRIAAIAAATALTATLITTGIAAPSTTLALPGASESTTVTVEPTRALDTRRSIGLTGNLTHANSSKLTITGPIVTSDETTTPATTPIKTVIPLGATGAILNVTSFNPTGGGFISIRPGDATGFPATSNLNVDAGQTIPNAVTVAIPTTGPNAGQIDITYGSTPGNNTGVIIDIVGYTTSTGLQDLTNRLVALETSGVAGPAGPQGPKGDTGDTGNTGNTGAPGTDLYERVLVVNGDQSAAQNGAAFVAAINTAATLSPTAASPVLVYLEPGTYDSDSVTVPSNVHVRGSGSGTILTVNDAIPFGAVTFGGVNEISDLRFDATLNSGTDLRAQRLLGRGEAQISVDSGETLRLLDSDIDTSAFTAVKGFSSSTVIVERSRIVAPSTAVTASQVLIIDSTMRGGNGVVSTAGPNAFVEINQSDLRSTDATQVISAGGASGSTFIVRDSYLENPDGPSILSASGATITILNSTVAANGDATINSFGAGAVPLTCIGIAEIDLGDGSSNSWNDTTCP